jgi:hypothetical protein
LISIQELEPARNVPFFYIWALDAGAGAFKKECFKESNNNQGLRAFKYAKGLTYFTTVKVAPLVEEVHEF